MRIGYALIITTILLAFFPVGAESDSVSDEAETRTHLINMTRLADSLYDDGKILRDISYTAPDGRAYLWRPGRSEILSGEWKIEQQKLGSRQIVSLCLRFLGLKTALPTTGPKALWHCQNISLFLKAYREKKTDEKQGDIFSLASRSAAPFPLTGAEASLAEIEQQIASRDRAIR
jgi:hypothetical protein